MGRLGWGHGRYFFALFGVIILKGGCVGRINKIIGGCSSVQVGVCGVKIRKGFGVGLSVL